MTPGVVLFDPSFTFHDGDQSPKLFILLTDATDGNILAVRTTSKQRHKNSAPGCQSDGNPPNFFIPKGTSSFPVDTWILLDETYEFKPDILNACIEARQISQKASLEKALLIDLLLCAMDSEDISQVHLDRLIHTKDSLS